MLRPTFFGFNTGLSALNASQKSLDIVGNNIANADTEGYTRQNIDLYSTPSISGTTKYAYNSVATSGAGVTIGGAGHIRDPYLDLRFRNQICSLGEAETFAGGLSDIQDVLGEIDVDGLGVRMQEFVEALNALAENTGKSEFEGMALDSAKNIVRSLNTAAQQLADVRDEQEYNLQTSVDDFNSCLEKIAALNKNIKNEQILGNSPLELIDSRNLLIDKVSKYAGVDIEYTKKSVDIAGITYDELSISLNGTTLLDHNQYSALTVSRDADNQTIIGLKGGLSNGAANANRAIASQDDINDLVTTGDFKGYIDLLNENGEFENIKNGIRGIGYYEKSLDTLARKLAETMNDANNTNVPTDKDLFAAADGNPKITAANLTIAEGWLSGEYGITNTKLDVQDDTTGDNTNILYMVTLFSNDTTLLTENGDKLFEGSLQQYVADIASTSHSELNSAKAQYNLCYSITNNVSDLRDSASSVSLNEEAVDMMKYQKAYSAASQYISMVNDLLDTLINNVGMVR